MGAIPHSRRSGILPVVMVCAAVLLAPTTGSAEDGLTDQQISPGMEIGETARDDAELAALTPLPSSIGRSSLDREVLCLARNIYWEAKSEPHIGKVAVAAVTLNRVADRRFPKDVCDVVSQRNGGRCQFSWACDRRRNVTPSGSLWQESLAVARQVLHLGHEDPTGGALFFHGTRERTDWRGVRRLVGRIGNHVFYR